MRLRTACALGALGLAWLASSGFSREGRPAPPFPSERAEDWLGRPQSLAALRGRVVLLDVWTFG